MGKKITVVVTGPKDVLKCPVTKRTSGKVSFREFLDGHVEPEKLMGLRVIRTCGGNPKEGMWLDTKIKRFIESKYTKEVRVYKAKLIRPIAKTRSFGGGSPEPEVITLDDEENEFFGEVDPGLVAGEGGGGVVSMDALKAEEEEEDEDGVSGVDASAPPEDGQRSCSGEQTAQEANLPDTDPAPQPSVTVKQEERIVKTEIPEPPESTIADLRARGVQIENLEAITREKIKIFSNPFLLLVREEVRKLRRENSYPWQSVVGKAPRCAYLVDELFK